MFNNLESFISCLPQCSLNYFTVSGRWLTDSISWVSQSHNIYTLMDNVPYASLHQMDFHLLQLFHWNRDNNWFISLVHMDTMNDKFKSSWQMSHAIDLVSYTVVWHTVRSIVVKTKLSNLYRSPEKSLGILVRWDLLTYDTRMNGIFYSMFMLASSELSQLGYWRRGKRAYDLERKLRHQPKRNIGLAMARDPRWGSIVIECFACLSIRNWWPHQSQHVHLHMIRRIAQIFLGNLFVRLSSLMWF